LPRADTSSVVAENRWRDTLATNVSRVESNAGAEVPSICIGTGWTMWSIGLDRATRHEILATTILAGVALAPMARAYAQTVTPEQRGTGSVTLPTIDVEGEGGGLGERFTGYSPDLNKPAAASKSNIPLIQAPYSIQVVPREVMDDQQASSLRDALLNNVSSVAVGYQFYNQFIIRGFDVGANIYRDNLRQIAVTNFETANLQAIEVLKGPAAMLFGRIEPGGLVDLVTKRPLLVFYYSVQEQAGSYGLTRTTIDVTGPLTEDKTLAYRFNGAYLHSDSFVNFVNNQNVVVAPTIGYQPIEQFRLNISAEYQNTFFIDTGDLGVVAIGNRPANIPISRYLMDPAVTLAHPNRQERGFIGYDWTFDISNNWSLTNRFGYSTADYNQALTDVSSVDQAIGDATRTLWYTFQNREIVSANLDLNGRLETGPLKHQILIGTKLPCCLPQPKMHLSTHRAHLRFWTGAHHLPPARARVFSANC
jgi:iron complex outermembrane receptor protein